MITIFCYLRPAPDWTFLATLRSSFRSLISTSANQLIVLFIQLLKYQTLS
jgi:hypothetical protein